MFKLCCRIIFRFRRLISLLTSSLSLPGDGLRYFVTQFGQILLPDLFRRAETPLASYDLLLSGQEAPAYGSYRRYPDDPVSMPTL